MGITIRIITLLVMVVLIGGCNGKKKKNELLEETRPVGLTEINQKIKNNPNDASAYNARAEYYINNNFINEAAKDANKAIQLDPNNSKYYITLSSIFLITGKVASSRSVLEKALSLNPEDTEVLLKLGELYLYIKDYKKTNEYINQALEINKFNPKIYFLRGYIKMETGDTLNAISDFQITVDQDQEFYEAYIQLGILYASQKNQIAVDYYNNALNIVPNSIEAYYNLAMFYQNTDEYNKALETYTTILAIDTKFKYAYFNMGFIQLEYLGVYNVAIQSFTDAIKCDPEYAEAYFNRGLAFETLGDIINARKDYEKSLQIRRNYQKAINGLNRLDKVDLTIKKQSE